MGMLTNPKLMLPFQIARICKTISNVRCDLRGGVCLLWGAQAASLQGSAACRTQPQNTFPAGCRKRQAGSLCSPDEAAFKPRLRASSADPHREADYDQFLLPRQIAAPITVSYWDWYFCASCRALTPRWPSGY